MLLFFLTSFGEERVELRWSYKFGSQCVWMVFKATRLAEVTEGTEVEKSRTMLPVSCATFGTSSEARVQNLAVS